MDKQMLLGCSAFVAASFLCYFAWVGPWFLWPDQHLLSVLAKVTVVGFGLSVLPGLFTTLRGGIAGGCGYLAGTMAGAVFVHLRIDQVLLGRLIPQSPIPEYPDSFSWLVPGLMIGSTALVVLVTLVWKKEL